MLQAFDAAHAAIKTLCQAQLDLRAKVGQPKWQDAGVQSEIDSRYASRFDALLAEHGLSGIALAEAEATAAELSGVTGNATEADMVRRVQVRAAIAAIGEKRRNDGRQVGRRGAVPRGAARAVRRRAGLQGAQVGQALRALRAHRDGAAAALPVARRRQARLARAQLRAQRGRLGLQADRAREDRDREAPARRSRGQRDPRDRDRGRRHARARTARGSSPAARPRR